MTDYGYDKKRFPNLNSENLDCPICTNVVMFPKECSGCGDLFCGRCIDDWTKKSKYFYSQLVPAPKDALESLLI